MCQTYAVAALSREPRHCTLEDSEEFVRDIEVDRDIFKKHDTVGREE